jgi:hypothetical protein
VFEGGVAKRWSGMTVVSFVVVRVPRISARTELHFSACVRAKGKLCMQFASKCEASSL